MRYALIDLGSNTIKLAVYDINGRDFKQIHYELRYGYVVANIGDGVLTKKGIDTIAEILIYFKGKALSLGAKKITCFSTASLRFIKNRDDVIKRIYDLTGIEINAISGEEEAYYNFLSIKYATGENSFIGADLGGGSCQVICCENGSLKKSVSLPLGCLKLFGQFVKGEFPDKSEKTAIEEYVKENLKGSFSPESVSDSLFLIGGSARTITRILNVGERFSTQLLTALTEDALKNTKEFKETILKLEPKRINTILPGMITINTLAEYLRINTITLIDTSVREGYLIDKVLEK